jgi:hypothetical protein
VIAWQRLPGDIVSRERFGLSVYGRQTMVTRPRLLRGMACAARAGPSSEGAIKLAAELAPAPCMKFWNAAPRLALALAPCPVFPPRRAGPVSVVDPATSGVSGPWRAVQQPSWSSRAKVCSLTDSPSDCDAEGTRGGAAFCPRAWSMTCRIEAAFGRAQRDLLGEAGGAARAAGGASVEIESEARWDGSIACRSCSQRSWDELCGIVSLLVVEADLKCEMSGALTEREGLGGSTPRIADVGRESTSVGVTGEMIMLEPLVPSPGPALGETGRLAKGLPMLARRDDGEAGRLKNGKMGRPPRLDVVDSVRACALGRADVTATGSSERAVTSCLLDEERAESSRRGAGLVLPAAGALPAPRESSLGGMSLGYGRIETRGEGGGWKERDCPGRRSGCIG